jgi:hypothetical protein
MKIRTTKKAAKPSSLDRLARFARHLLAVPKEEVDEQARLYEKRKRVRKAAAKRR